jgi:hypothetical protein
MPTRSQKLAVALAFVAAALSLTAAAISFFRDGTLDTTPIFGGLLMLALGIGGISKIRKKE